VFMDAHNTVTVEEGDRYPSRPPNFEVSVAVESAIKHGSPVARYSARHKEQLLTTNKHLVKMSSNQFMSW